MAWSSDTSIPIDHTKVSDVPGAVRDVKLGLESGAITMSSKVLVAPVVDSIRIPKTSVTPAAVTGYFSVIATSVLPTTSGVSIITPSGAQLDIVKDDALYADTGFTIARTASLNSNLQFFEAISTAVANILVANTASSTTMRIGVITVDANDAGSVELIGAAAAAAATGTRGAGVAVFGNEHGSAPGQIVLQPGFVSTNATTRAAIVCKSAWIKEVLDPVDTTDAVTKSYFESKVGAGTIDPVAQSSPSRSITFPNGLIMKFGANAFSVPTASETITFNTSFNSIIAVVITPGAVAHDAGLEMQVISKTTDDFTVSIAGETAGGGNSINWIAIGV